VLSVWICLGDNLGRFQFSGYPRDAADDSRRARLFDTPAREFYNPDTP